MNYQERIYNLLTEALSPVRHARAVSHKSLYDLSMKAGGVSDATFERAAGRGLIAKKRRQRRLATVERGRPIRQAVAQRTDGGEEVVDVPGREPGVSPTGKKKISRYPTER